jgi:cobalt-zinc-cadmium resistance protein CzcA
MVFKYSSNVYRPVLLSALKFRWLVVVAASILVIISIWLATRFGSEFIPQLDESDQYSLLIPNLSCWSDTG